MITPYVGQGVRAWPDLTNAAPDAGPDTCIATILDAHRELLDGEPVWTLHVVRCDPSSGPRWGVLADCDDALLAAALQGDRRKVAITELAEWLARRRVTPHPDTVRAYESMRALTRLPLKAA